jgi:D-3-phosphoglycerate dehydrogenase
MEKLKNMRVLIAELMEDEIVAKISSVCNVDVKLKLSREEILKIIPDYNAIIVRSETLVDEEFLDAAVNLKIVGRAGSGLDNINIPYATQKGVIVANTPESNIMSACEHSFALMLSVARHVSWASGFIKSGKWDRKRFNGRELYGKTLGIIGLGRIGSLVSQRAKGFGMKVIAFDPYIADSRFEKFGVEKKLKFEDLLKESDFITIHTPRTKETINIVNDREIEMMKDGVILVNCARGGLYNEDALYRGIKSGKLAGLGLDVWNNEPQSSHPLYEFDNVVGTPHLGASTFEAQIRVGEEVVDEVIAGLKGEMVKNAVNIPSVSETSAKKLKAFIDLAEKLGKIYSDIRKESISKVEIDFAGKEVDNKDDMKAMSIVTLKGVLDGCVPETVNFVNANLIAEQRGIQIIENISIETTDYSNLLKLKVTEKDNNVFEIHGTVYDKVHLRVTRIGEYEVDITPHGKLLYIPHKNVPGVIGKVGMIMSNYNVNISKMFVSNSDKDSIMIARVDNNVPQELLNKLQDVDEILDIKLINL